MPEYLIVPTAERRPGACLLCQSTAGPFVDLLLDTLHAGRLYLCIGSHGTGCAPQMAAKMGWASPEQWAALNQILLEAEGEIEELTAGVTVGRPIEIGELSFELAKLEARVVARLRDEDPIEAERAVVPPVAAPRPDLAGRGTILLEDAPESEPAVHVPPGAMRPPVELDPDTLAAQAEAQAGEAIVAADPRLRAMEAARARGADGGPQTGAEPPPEGLSMAEADAAFSSGPEDAPPEVRQALAGMVAERTGVAPPAEKPGRRRR